MKFKFKLIELDGFALVCIDDSTTKTLYMLLVAIFTFALPRDALGQDALYTSSVTTLAGSTAGFLDATGASARFSNPQGMAVDASSNVIVADANNNRIRKVTPGGVVATLAGSTLGFLDATGASAQFFNPFGVAVDASGNVIVADNGNQRIRKITPGGVVTTLAGSTRGSSDATGASAQFSNPVGVAVDASGNVIVADYSNNRIRKVTPGGVVTTLAGSTQGFFDATGTSALFLYPSGVAVDASGNVIVADTYNNRIRKVHQAVW